MGDNKDANQSSNSIQVQRCLVLTDADVIRFREPMAQLIVSNEYDSRVANELTDINEYSVENIESIKSKQKFNQIIGWSQLIKGISGVKTLLFKQRDDNQRMEAMQVFTDTIFPVLTLKNSDPFEYEVDIDEEIPQEFKDKKSGKKRYNTCIQLVLMDSKKKDTRIDVRADVSYKSFDGSLVFDTLDAYKADLRLFHSKPSIKTLSFQAIIGQILDKRDPKCPYVGLYAGPDLPPQKYRQCWPVFEPNSKPQNISREQRSPFRHKAGPKKPFVRRVGYLVSKHSLLCVCERYQGQSTDFHRQNMFKLKPDEYYFTSLLKDNTFCICDSRHLYANYKHQEYDEICFEPIYMPFKPKVVIIPEGLNSIVIHDVNTTIEDKQPYYYIASQLSGQRLYIQNILSLDWYQFQSDFDGSNQPIEPYFKIKSKLLEINDYGLEYHKKENTWICFSLSNTLKKTEIYTEHYNVFAQLPGQVGDYDDHMYQYFISMKIEWKFDWKVIMDGEKKNQYVIKYIKLYKPIDDPLTNLTNLSFETHINWIKSHEKWFAHLLATNPIHFTENLSPLSINKMFLKGLMKMHFTI